VSNGEVKTVAIPLTKTDMGVYVIDGIANATTCKLYVMRGSIAEKAGVKDGDILLSLNSNPVLRATQFIEAIPPLVDQDVKLTVLRGDQTVAISVVPKYDPNAKKAMIGVQAIDGDMLPWMQYKNPWDQIKSDATGIVRILQALGTPKESKQAAEGLGGPVLILIALWGAIKISFLNGLGFIRFLNVNLAILNLLPIPVLDGGHVVFSLWEGITRRRVHPKVVNTLVNVFATLLIGVMLILTYRDVVYRLPHFFRFGRGEDGAKAKTPVETVTNTNSQPASVEQTGE
jgi:regulator of sigma E protease